LPLSLGKYCEEEGATSGTSGNLWQEWHTSR